MVPLVPYRSITTCASPQRLRNDLKCVEWDVKPCTTTNHGSAHTSTTDLQGHCACISAVTFHCLAAMTSSVAVFYHHLALPQVRLSYNVGRRALPFSDANTQRPSIARHYFLHRHWRFSNEPKMNIVRCRSLCPQRGLKRKVSNM